MKGGNVLKVAIVGLGQIGGSMALKLQKNGLQPDLFDIDPEVCNLLNAKCEEFDRHGYDLVVLALHLPVLLKKIERLPNDNLYLDTASVKFPVVEKARKIGLKFIGGHPIAGNERIGPESWDSEMFNGRPFALVSVDASKREKKIAEKFVEILGAHVVWTEASKHDIALAYTSHAPYFVSTVLKKLGNPYKELSGPGYASMVRLANQNPKLGRVFEKYNSQNVADALEKIAIEIRKVADEVRRC